MAPRWSRSRSPSPRSPRSRHGTHLRGGRPHDLHGLGQRGRPQPVATEYTRSGWFLGAHSYLDLELELDLELPERDVTVDLDHDPQHQVGEPVYAELGAGDRLRCVTVVNDLKLDEADQDVFFSPLLMM